MYVNYNYVNKTTKSLINAFLFTNLSLLSLINRINNPNNYFIELNTDDL